MSDIFYKIRHKSTGLFFKPSTSGKCNLSKNGKAYGRKPSLSYLWGKIYTGERDSTKGYYERNITMDVIPSDWEICVYETVLRETIQCGDKN
jgi:hypothetical protein